MCVRRVRARAAGSAPRGSTFVFRESVERQRQDAQVGDVREHGIYFEGWFGSLHHRAILRAPPSGRLG